MKSRFQEIARIHGYEMQSRQCIEEMAELTQAINKFWRKQLDCGNIKFENANFQNAEYNNLVEEIADVQVMIEQMKILMGCEKAVSDMIEKKMAREMKRILSKTD